MPPPAAVRARVAGVAGPVTEAAAAEGCSRQEAPVAPTGSRPVPKPYQRVASVAMAEPSPLPPPNSGLRILFAKDCAATSSPSVPAVVSSHADRDRLIGVFRTALSRNEAPEAFALQAVQEAIKPLKQTVLVLEENQTLENALRRLLQELVAEKDEKMRLRHGEGREGRDRQVGHRAEEVRDRRWVHEGGSIIGRERQASL